MKSNLEILNICDQPHPDPASLYRFLIEGYEVPFGHITPDVAKRMPWGENWLIDHDARTAKLLGTSLDDRTQIMHEMLVSAREKHTFKLLAGWQNEPWPVYGPNKKLVLSIERAAAPLFGIVAYGVQLLAYEGSSASDDLKIWIARRAKTKRTFPGMLDSTVGGSMSTGETPFECLVRECEEEASFSEGLVRTCAVAAGTVNFVHVTDERYGGESGLPCPEIDFVYDMQLPEGVIPVPNDGEVEEMVLLSVEEVKSALAMGKFPPANGYVILDFFVRHGILTWENERDYVEIVSRLRRRLDFQTA
ncbi:hypothetical protein AJ80_07644 [Polytolypa hystricis UAMH7299]|uniref:Nudix hydrolase domain-containing protein n=1 Tax=Polytolypa hystricis (strain UAMH7299) TaxID=1447883 RepID=A0A2B7XLM2_POLH7|nr:hypothetical protein AJ80_07644 [Polytolypa hystricis UAMH7299]